MEDNTLGKNGTHDKDYELWVLLNQARHIIYRAREYELSHSGISAAQAEVLTTIEAIDHEAAATPAEISRRLLQRAHSISTIINRMEKKGLIVKVKDLERRNMVRVVITQKGYAAYYESFKRNMVCDIMDCLTKDECKALRSGLRRLRDGALEKLKTASQPIQLRCGNTTTSSTRLIESGAGQSGL